MPNEDYVKKLIKDYEEIADKVERGMLPLVARIPAIDKAVCDYVEAQDVHFESMREEGGYVPIQYRDSHMLDKFADLIMYEELTWSHPDKMSIVEYPVMSDWQAKDRREKTSFPGEITYDDRQFNGRRKGYSVGKSGEINVTNHRIPNLEDSGIKALEDKITVAELLEGAKLTDRQRQAIELVYFEDMTQEQAAKVMGVGQDVISRRISVSIKKIKKLVRNIP